MKNDNRQRLMDILQILYERTDQDHYIDTYEILDAIEAMGHGRPDRKTIDPHIDFLRNEMHLSFSS